MRHGCCTPPPIKISGYAPALTRVESFSKKVPRVTIVSQRDSSRVTKLVTRVESLTQVTLWLMFIEIQKVNIKNIFWTI